MKRLFFSAVLLLPALFASSQRLPSLIPYRKGNLWGYCDSTKKMVIEPRFKSAELFSDGLAYVEYNDSLHGFIDSLGNIKLLFTRKISIHDPFSCNRAKISKIVKGGSTSGGQLWVTFKVGFIDKNGRLIIPMIFSEDDLNMDFFEGHAAICYHRKEGIIDTSGKFTLQSRRKYFHIEIIDQKFARVHFRSGQIGIYDMSKQKWAIRYSGEGQIQIREKLLMKGYVNADFDAIFPMTLKSERILWRRIVCFGPSPGYIDKYGTQYWED